MEQLNKTDILRTFGEYRAINAEARTAEFVLSSETKDRHGTIINVDGWKLDNYRKNPIVLHQHRSAANDPDAIIGVSEVWVENKQLMGRVTFEPKGINPLAEKIFQKVQLGTMRATSVGFNPIRGNWGKSEEDNDTYYFTECDLMEWSIVNIPSNPDAILKKSFEQVRTYLEAQKENTKTKTGRLKANKARYYFKTKYKA